MPACLTRLNTKFVFAGLPVVTVRPKGNADRKSKSILHFTTYADTDKNDSGTIVL